MLKKKGFGLEYTSAIAINETITFIIFNNYEKSYLYHLEHKLKLFDLIFIGK